MLEIIKLREKLQGRFACNLHEAPRPSQKCCCHLEVSLALACTSSLTSKPCTPLIPDVLFLPVHL